MEKRIPELIHENARIEVTMKKSKLVNVENKGVTEHVEMFYCC